MLARLGHVRTWIFDLDNTLYPARASLFPQIEQRITRYIAERFDLPEDEAFVLQKRYFIGHGTTLAGLMAEHDVDPHAFLAFVHDVEMDVLEADAPLAAAIATLPGRKIVFTNGDAPYAVRVLARLGLAEAFEGIHDVHAARYRPKPDPHAYESLCERFGVDPATALFVEDMARNLRPAKAIGMTTVWVDNGSEQAPDEDRSFIDFTTPDLVAWLNAIQEAL